MVLALFSGCGKQSAVEQFFGHLKDMNRLNEYTSSQNVNLKLTASALSKYDEDGMLRALFGESGLNISVNSENSMSAENRQLASDVSVKFEADGMRASFDITDYLIDGDTLYLNIEKPRPLVSSFAGVDLSGFPLADYLMIDITDETGSSTWDKGPGTEQLPEELKDAAPLLEALVGVIKDKIINADPAYVTESDGIYTLTLNREAIIEFLSIIISDLRDNAAVYYDGFKSMYNSGSYISGENVLPFGNRETDISALIKAADNLLSSLSELPDMKFTASVSYDAAALSYSTLLHLDIQGILTLNINKNLVSETVDTIAVPEIVMTVDELFRALEPLFGSPYNETEAKENSLNIHSFLLSA